MSFIFIDYSSTEELIFNGVKEFFEKLPASIDDYKNGFYDVVAQFAGGGSLYLFIGKEYEHIIETQISIHIENLKSEDKKELQKLYEDNFLENYYDEKTDSYFYSDDELTLKASERFNSWIDDNFDLDEMMNEEEDDEEEDDEYDEDDDNEDGYLGVQNVHNENLEVSDIESEKELDSNEVKQFESSWIHNRKITYDAVKLLMNSIDLMLNWSFSENEKRLLLIAKVYLSFHPLASDQDFSFNVKIKTEQIIYEMQYSSHEISLAEYIKDIDPPFYRYYLIINRKGAIQEHGQMSLFWTNVEAAFQHTSNLEILISKSQIV